MADEAGATEEAPARRVRGGRRKLPARSKSVDDSGSLATMRAKKPTRNGEGGEGAAAEGGGGPRRARRGGRRTPARTKSADDLQIVSRMARHSRQKSQDDKPDEASPEAAENQ